MCRVFFRQRGSHCPLVEMLQTRVADGSLLRLIGKCLHVGVLDGAEFIRPEDRQPPRGRCFRRCSATFTCTTYSTCGSKPR